VKRICQATLSRTRPVPVFALLAFALSACSAPAVVVGGGATAGVAVAQERTVGDAVDDATIVATVNKLWAEHDWTLFTHLDVTVHEGRALLTGNVKTPQDRLEAVRLAWRAKGVREVINEIEVTDRGGVVNYARDGWISAQLRTKITFDETIRAINYSIETVNGVVYLMGIAQNQEELDRVTDYARNIRYVRSVVSHVWLKTDPRRVS
jgi:osmotically-inducible protein OsmY